MAIIGTDKSKPIRMLNIATPPAASGALLKSKRLDIMNPGKPKQERAIDMLPTKVHDKKTQTG